MANRGFHSSLLWLCILSFSLAVQGQNLLTNGGFEYPVIKDPPFGNENVFGYAIPGWQVTSGNVDLYNKNVIQWSTNFPAAERNQSLNLNGVVSGSIGQLFTTLPNNPYQVSFTMTGNTLPLCKSVSAMLLYSLRVNIRSLDFTSTPITQPPVVNVTIPSTVSVAAAGAYFTPFSFNFTAQAPMSSIEFVSLNPGCGGPIIDAVAVTTLSSPSLSCPNPPTNPSWSPERQCPSGFNSMTTAKGCTFCIDSNC